MNRRAFLAALAGLPFLPSALAAAPVEPIPWWRAAVPPASRPLTFAMMQRAMDRVTVREFAAGRQWLLFRDGGWREPRTPGEYLVPTPSHPPAAQPSTPE